MKAKKTAKTPRKVEHGKPTVVAAPKSAAIPLTAEQVREMESKAGGA